LRLPALAGATLMLALCAHAPARAAEASDPAAVALAADVMRALGGEDAWNALPGLRWTFGVEIADTVRTSRRHAWNKHSGWHRVEGRDRHANPFVIVHHVERGVGRAWVAGNEIHGDSLRVLLERGKALWVNDTYWMLMPYKLRDPGVILALDEPRTVDGVLCDRLALRFENVGLTPGDRYWVEVERGTHRVRGWEMVLQGREPPPVRYTWEGWEAHDGLWFPTAHRDGDRNVFTRDIEMVRVFQPREFDAP
jgi:hypothetical protein